MRWSLKWKIQFWHGLILIVVVLLLGILFYRHEREIMIRETDWMLNQSFQPVMLHTVHSRFGKPADMRRGVRPGDGMEDVPPEWYPVGIAATGQKKGTPIEPPPEGSVWDGFEEKLSPLGYYFLVWDESGGDLIYSSKNAPEIDRPPIRPRGAFQREVPGERRELFQRFRGASAVVGRYTDGLEAKLRTLQIRLLIGGLLLVGVAMLVGNFLVFRSLRPLQGIRRTTRNVAAGQLAERIESESKQSSLEIAELTDDLNETFASLENLVHRQASFTADASHELRTPLTALIAQIKRGQQGGRSEEDYQFIFELCGRSLTRLKRIVEDLLELSRFDSGRVELDREELAIDVLVETIVEDYRLMIEERGSLILCDAVAACAYCDPFRIEQVISNFISNALNHNSEPVCISLSIKAEESWVIIEVEDNGIGIPAEYHEFLFDRFFQEKKSRPQSESSRKSKNSGLGLAISKAIVEAHGGTIHVRSELEVATVFEVRLPRYAQTEE